MHIESTCSIKIIKISSRFVLLFHVNTQLNLSIIIAQCKLFSFHCYFQSISSTGDVFLNYTTIIGNNFIITDAIEKWTLLYYVNINGSTEVFRLSWNVLNKQIFIQFTKTTFNATKKFIIQLFVQLGSEPFVWNILRFNENVNKVKVFSISHHI